MAVTVAILAALVAEVLLWKPLFRSLFQSTVTTSSENQANVRLLEAAYNGDIRAMEDAIALGADPNVSVLGNPAIFVAANRGRDAIIGVLLEHGADINARTVAAGRSALHEAALRGNLSTFCYLLAHGADVNARNNNGRTPLYYVTIPPPPLSFLANAEEIARVLREHGGK